jgi:hypothetical protein
VTAGVAPARGSATGAVTEVATVEAVVLLRGVALEVGLVGFNVKCEWQFSQPTHTHNFARPWPSHSILLCCSSMCVAAHLTSRHSSLALRCRYDGKRRREGRSVRETVDLYASLARWVCSAR